MLARAEPLPFREGEPVPQHEEDRHARKRGYI
jgi:hypothetical protein